MVEGCPLAWGAPGVLVPRWPNCCGRVAGLPILGPVIGDGFEAVLRAALSA